MFCSKVGGLILYCRFDWNLLYIKNVIVMYFVIFKIFKKMYLNVWSLLHVNKKKICMAMRQSSSVFNCIVMLQPGPNTGPSSWQTF